jgi:hypothetical protein
VSVTKYATSWVLERRRTPLFRIDELRAQRHPKPEGVALAVTIRVSRRPPGDGRRACLPSRCLRDHERAFIGASRELHPTACIVPSQPGDLSPEAHGADEGRRPDHRLRPRAGHPARRGGHRAARRGPARGPGGDAKRWHRAHTARGGDLSPECRWTWTCSP